MCRLHRRVACPLGWRPRPGPRMRFKGVGVREKKEKALDTFSCGSLVGVGRD